MDWILSPDADQTMGPRAKPTPEEAFERIKKWLEMNHAASGDEAITNMRAAEIVNLVLRK